MNYVLGDNFVSYFVSYILGVELVRYKSLERLDRNHGQDSIPPVLIDICKHFFSDCRIIEYEENAHLTGQKTFTNFTVYTQEER